MAVNISMVTMHGWLTFLSLNLVVMIAWWAWPTWWRWGRRAWAWCWCTTWVVPWDWPIVNAGLIKNAKYTAHDKWVVRIAWEKLWPARNGLYFRLRKLIDSHILPLQKLTWTQFADRFSVSPRLWLRPELPWNVICAWLNECTADGTHFDAYSKC